MKHVISLVLLTSSFWQLVVDHADQCLGLLLLANANLGQTHSH
jgi:hypothetical protein